MIAINIDAYCVALNAYNSIIKKNNYITYRKIEDMVSYKLIKRNNDSLLIYFNCMIFVGEDDRFGCFKTFCDIFTCDILFIKDIAPGLWYLTIMEQYRALISQLITDNSYKHVYAIADSSGTIPLLNITKSLPEFKRAFIINGQPTLAAHIVDRYKHCTDCAIFDPSIITNLNMEYLSPLENVTHDILGKYTFYINNSISDNVNYEYLKTIYPEHLHMDHLIFEATNETHYDYICRKFRDAVFLCMLVNNLRPNS